MTSLVSKLTAKSTDADFAKCVASIHKRAASVQTDIHLYLVAVAVRWTATGDSRPAAKMVNALLADMPKGLRSNAIREYVEKCFGLQFDDESQTFKAVKMKASQKSTTELMKTYWYDFKPEPEYKGMDFKAALDKLLKDAVKRDGKPNEADNIDMDMVRAVQKAVASKSMIEEAVA